MTTLSVTPEARRLLQAAINKADVAEPVINLVFVGSVVTPTPEELERARSGDANVLSDLYRRGAPVPKALSPTVRDRSDYPGQRTIEVEGMHFLLPPLVLDAPSRLVLRVTNDGLELTND